MLVFVLLLFSIILYFFFLLKNRKKNSLIKNLFFLFFLISLSVFIKAYCFELISVKSISMETTFHDGDLILINKLAYGPRSIESFFDIPWIGPLTTHILKRVEEKKYSTPTARVFYNNDINKGDIVIFEHYYNNSYLIKRCVGVPGDTVFLNNFSNSYQEYDSQITRNEIEDFIIVPVQGIPYHIDDDFYYNFREVIIRFEGEELLKRAGQYYLNGEPATSYSFSRNYMFVVGDNRRFSIDSRTFGVIPYDLIIGKAISF
ncbi:signal peptidase I [Roseivirga pacifica]|uniref:signal peptidase I n=1 Tax=Roseivirga pacifica TaxID=1267423 RepID=UPI003BAFF82A